MPRTVRDKRRVTGIAALTVAALATGAGLASPASAGGVPVDFSGPTWTGAATAPTADKQQSKLWRADGAWWAVMISKTKGLPTIHERRANNTWRDTLTVVDNRADSTADVWYTGGLLFAVSRTLTGDIRYYRFRYNPVTRGYARLTGYPVKVASGGTESASMARDSIGRVWATWTQGGRVYVSRTLSKTNHTTWLAPRVVPVPDNTVLGDDVSAIVAWDGKIGIMWSDQQDEVFRFAVHPDSAGIAKSWTMETPIPTMPGLADDHISLKASGKRVFAAVKTGFDSVGATETSPDIYVLRRNVNGTWTRAKAASIADKSTRPQIVLDRTNSRIYFFATASVSGGSIYYKSSPMLGLKFARGRGAPILSNTGSVINNVTSIKSSVAQAAGIVVLAADENSPTYFHSKLSITPADGQPPIIQNAINSTVNVDGSVTTTWPLATDDRFVTEYVVYRDGSKIATINAATAANQDKRTFSYNDPNPAAGPHRYSLRALDAAGNKSLKRTGSEVVVP
jgi:hypothetical protein